MKKGKLQITKIKNVNENTTNFSAIKRITREKIYRRNIGIYCLCKIFYQYINHSSNYTSVRMRNDSGET